MIKKLKKYTIQMMAGANVTTIIMMWLIGYSDRVNPIDFPLLSILGLGFPVFLLLNLGFLVFWLLFKTRGALIPIAGFLLCYVPVRKYCPLNVSREIPDSAIKVLSYNVWLFDGWDVPKGEKSPILEYIKNQNADVVCLQEASAGELGQDRIDSVLDRVYEYKDSCMKGKYGDVLSIYSKYPIIRKEKIDYPSKGNQSAAFYLKIRKDTVIVINNHMETTGLSPDIRDHFTSMIKGKMETDSTTKKSKLLITQLGEGNKKRAVEADAVNAFVEAHLGQSIILCGDFNDGPISYSRRTIAQNLTDCYVASGNGPGVSYHKSGFYVRIDHIMCSADWEPFQCTVDNKIKDSDHYPIYCWLKRRPKP